MTPEIRHLLGGYATGTLTDDERARLFAAALDDQALFDALAEEQPLKDLLDDPESRGYLLAELDQPAQTEMLREAVRMAKMARSAPAPTSTSVSMPPPPKPTARFWLPFAAVMMALLVTGWFWWRSAPEPNMQVAVNAPPATIMPAPVAPKQSPPGVALRDNLQPPSGAGPRPAFIPAPNRTAAPMANSAPETEPASPPKPAEAGREMARADTIQPFKKELDAVEDKARVNQAAAPPASASAPAAPTGNLARPAPPAYRLLRLQNGQYVPTSAAARFQAGDTIVILLPVQATEPQLALADGPSIALEREGDWYRSAKIELQAGSPEFLVTPSSAADRSRFAAGQEAKAKAKAGTLLRIRLTVD